MLRTFVLLIVGVSGTTALAASTLGTVGGAPITVEHAETLRAVIAPPPSREAAERLVLDAARAHQALRGYVVPAAPRTWLDAYRAEELARRAGVTGDSVLDPVLRRASSHADLFRVEAVRVLPGAGKERPSTRAARRAVRALSNPGSASASANRRIEPIDLGWIWVAALERPLGAALRSLRAGRWSEPIRSDSGVYLLRIVERCPRGEYWGDSCHQPSGAAGEPPRPQTATPAP